MKIGKQVKGTADSEGADPEELADRAELSKGLSPSWNGI